MIPTTLLYKEVLSAAAIALTFIAFLPYIRDIKREAVKPHVFSWVIWGSTTFVVFLAQLADKGGVGAWPIGVSGLVTIYIAVLAYTRRGDISITPVDWIFFVPALSALPLWYVTSDPLWAVVILTGVDLLGFGPTLRKAYARPFEEQLSLPVLMSVRNLFALLALEHYSMTTVLFPALTGLACLLWIAILMVRRRVVLLG
ncbi:MAG: hypothetical protein R6X15_03730 [Pseudomonadota bacterium]